MYNFLAKRTGEGKKEQSTKIQQDWGKEKIESKEKTK